MTDIKKNILIIGDSLAGDRLDMDGLLIESRWPYLLSKLVEDSYYTVNQAIPASTSRRLLSRKESNADLNIIQLGIVDCVPRYFNKFESSLLSKIPNRFRIVLIEYLKSRRHQSMKRAYVNKEEFRYNFETFLNNIQGGAIVIKILVPETKHLMSNHGALNSVNEYNKIIDNVVSRRKRVKVASISNELVGQFTLDDGYHLNKNGHIYLSELLKSLIQ